MPKDSFLFVPYHAGRSNQANAKLANSDARSHAAAVSRQRRDNKRLRDQLGLHPETDVVGAHVNALALSNEVLLPQDPESTFLKSLDKSDSPTSRGESRIQKRQRMRAMQFSWRAGNMSAELKISGGLRVDPFDITPTSAYTKTTVDYFMQVISPVNQPIYAIFNVTNIYTSYWLELMRHEDYKPMGVAMVGAIMHHICNPGAKPPEDVKSNQALAISRLQKKLSDASRSGSVVADDISIITVLALANLARFLGDSKAYVAHRSNVKTMVSSRGGLDALGHDGLVAASVSQWDSFWAIEKDAVSLFSDSRTEHQLVYPAFPLSEDLRDKFIKLPVGFQSLILMGKVSVELIDVLGRTAEALANGVQTLSPENMWHSKTRKHRDFLEACPTLALPDTSRTIIEKHMTLALFLYCANTFTSARSSTSLFGASRMELTRLLKQVDDSVYIPPEKQCLYWICVVCVDSWRQSGPQSQLLPKGLALLPVLKRMRNGLSSTNVLQCFFHNKELVDGCERYLGMMDESSLLRGTPPCVRIANWGSRTLP